MPERYDYIFGPSFPLADPSELQSSLCTWLGLSRPSYRIERQVFSNPKECVEMLPIVWLCLNM